VTLEELLRERYEVDVEPVTSTSMNKTSGAVLRALRRDDGKHVARSWMFHEQRAAYILDAELGDELAEKAQKHDEFVTNFAACAPYLNAAVAAGIGAGDALGALVHIESGDVVIQWTGLANLMSQTPTRHLAGEHGEGIGRGSLTGMHAGTADEDYAAFGLDDD
jgi:hypothetical protein